MHLPTLILLVGIVHAATVTGAPAEKKNKANPKWADENRFGKFQDAWATINDTAAKYYMVRATYNKDNLLGRDFSCVTIKSTSADEKELSVKAHMTYRTNGQPKTKDVSTKATTSYSYKKPNTLDFGEKDGKSEVGVLVFSNPSTCDVISVKDGKELELWVHENVKNEVPLCCEFIFEFFKPKGRNTQILYSDEKCKDESGKAE